MPISFILVGLVLIYIIFYSKNTKYKNVSIAMFIFIMIGFFVKEINILNGVLLNVFIFVPIIIFSIYFIVNLNNIEGILFFCGVSISIAIYSILVKNDMEVSTLFSPTIPFLISTFLVICFGFSINLFVSYTLFIFSMYDILNILLIKNSTGVVTILPVSTFSLIVYDIIIGFAVYKLIEFVKLKTKEKVADD